MPISGANAKRVLFGAIHLNTGRRVFLARRRAQALDFQAYLEELRCVYRGRDVALLLDEDSSHTAYASQRLADELRVELLWLPKRSPHLNPMDHLWRHGKQIKSANHQYTTIDEQTQEFTDYLNGLSAEEALRKAGLGSTNSWLRL